MFGTLKSDQKQNWKTTYNPFVFAYNIMEYISTGYSPFELMLSRKPRIHVHNMFQIENEDFISTEYAKDLKKQNLNSTEYSRA